jgi:hypothetical protein
MVVSEKTVRSRINRHLAKEGQKLHKTREGSREMQEYGDYYIVDDRNCVSGPYVESLEQFGRELGVLAARETIATASDA